MYSQDECLVLNAAEKHEIFKEVTSKRKKDIPFYTRIKNLDFESSKKDSLFFQREKYLVLKNRIQKEKQLKDSLGLFSRDVGRKLTKNFNNYRKSISELLNYDEFYLLFKEIIEPQISQAIQFRVEKLKLNYQIDRFGAELFKEYFYPHQKQLCILREYYIYNSKLNTFRRQQYEALIQPEVKSKIAELGFKPHSDLNNSKDLAVEKFVSKASKVGVSKKHIQSLVKGIIPLKQELENTKQFASFYDENLLYTLNDPSLQSQVVHKKIAKLFADHLTIKQFEDLFYDQLKDKIEIETTKDYVDLLETYQPTLNEKQHKVFKDWVKTFVTKRIVASQYYKYEKSIMLAKLNIIEFDAEQKYVELLNKLSTSTIHTMNNLEPYEQDFLINAEGQGISPKKAKGILLASKRLRLHQDELHQMSKYQNEYVFDLNIESNSKKGLKNKFKHALTKKLTQTEFGKLFWGQLRPEIKRITKNRVKEAQEVYNFKPAIRDELYNFIQDYVTKEVIASQYYSYDKKVAKQKAKTLKFKYKNAYNKKITELKNLNK